VIITASRIATVSGAGRVGSHVFSGPKNEAIELVQGSLADLDDMVRDAEDHGAKYAIRHYKISPEQATTRQEALAVLAALGTEFRFDPARAVLVEHQKPRQGGKGYDRHWHAMVGEVDPVRGRVLDAHWMRPRQEKVARVAEIELGHGMISGKWNSAVERALRADGRDDLADRVQRLADGERPRSAYTTTQHQVVERRGASMPELKAAVADAWSRSDNGAAFRLALAQHGLTARPGDKKGIWLIEAAGPDGEPVLVGSLARLTHAKSGDVAARMAEPAQQAIAPAVLAAQETVAAADGGQPGLGGAPEPTPTPELTPITIAAADPVLEHSPAGTPAPALSSPAAGGRSPGKASGAGTGTGGGGSDPFLGIAPLDLSKPGDWQRFLTATANAARQKQKADAAAEMANSKQSSPTGEQHHGHPADPFADLREIVADRVREIIAAWRATAADQRPEGAPRTSVEPPADRAIPGRGQSPGADGSHLEERAGSPRDRRVDLCDPPGGTDPPPIKWTPRISS